MTTTSPEALREAVERVAQIQASFSSISPLRGIPQFSIKQAREHAADLTLVLSALQEARGALGPFASAWDRSNPAAPYSTSPRIFPAIADFRRAAEVYRALSPGGADE